MQLRGDNFHDLFIEVLDAHANDYEFVNSPRGHEQKEKLFTQLVLENPIERVCYLPERKVNLAFQYAEVLWYLGGTDLLEQIEYYAPRMRMYSADGKTLPGTAYGKKIFHYQNCVDQWSMVREILRADPESKRAVISIYDPNEGKDPSSIDVSCTLSLQFLIRDGALHLITTMRANDVYIGESSDVFSFTILQELMACELGVSVGRYYHQVGSSHLYATDYEKADKVLRHRRPFSAYGLSFPAMPREDNSEYVKIVLECERELRENSNLSSVKGCLESLPNYWRDVLNLFELHRQMKHEGIANMDGTRFADPAIAYFAYMSFMGNDERTTVE